ncbi:hypothetical protein [Nocardia wallacei]|uniref:hypothetical protein n=1 Tax=Nocardia wallacei TaxID=480035 RepID=UPI00245678BB|nr:hypothetical protein [Nocardia wallacei]
MPPIHALSQRRAALEQEWARWAPVHAVPAGQTVLRSEVVQSWRRSLPTVDPGRPAAPADDGELGARWSHSPLRAPVTELADELRSIADDSGFVAAVTDERGTILWSWGGGGVGPPPPRGGVAPPRPGGAAPQGAHPPGPARGPRAPRGGTLLALGPRAGGGGPPG